MSWDFGNKKGQKILKEKALFLEEISISGRNSL